MATGSSRRRVLSGLGAIAMGTLLGRAAEAKPSGNKGKSGTNGNADCNAVCAHDAKDARKDCQDKDKKAAKKRCLKNVKKAQAECREKCVPTDNTVPATVPATETGADSGGTGDLSILAKAVCQPGEAGDQFCEGELAKMVAAGTLKSPHCLVGKCTKDVRDGKTRCDYQRDPSDCSDGTICCPYSTTRTTSGQCVQAGPEGDRGLYCRA